MDHETTLLVLSNRNFLYNLIARGFAGEPDETFIAILKQEHTRQELLLVSHEDTPQVLEAYEAALDAVPADDALAHLQHEYVRTFVGPGTLKAYPWETVHLSDTHALFQPELIPIRESYRAAGFLPARYPHVQDDFIGLEFDFLAKLSQSALQACESGDTAAMDERLGQARTFLDEHLLRWIDSLANAIEREYGDSFYARFAKLAALVAKRDRAIL